MTQYFVEVCLSTVGIYTLYIYRMMLSSSSPYSRSSRSSRASLCFRLESQSRSAFTLLLAAVASSSMSPFGAAVSTWGGVCMLSAASAMTSIARRFPLAFSLIGGATELEWEAAAAASYSAGASGGAGAVLR